MQNIFISVCKVLWLGILHILVNNDMLEGEERRVWEKQTKYIFCLENVFKFLLIEKLF